jgi:hypothetical protein
MTGPFVVFPSSLSNAKLVAVTTWVTSVKEIAPRHFAHSKRLINAMSFVEHLVCSPSS